MHILKSACVHLGIVTALVIFGSAAHQVQKQIHVEHVLFMPADLPVPIVRLVSVNKPAVTAQPTVVRLAPGAPSIMHTPRVDEQPRMDALSAPQALDLPSITSHVTEAPQVNVGAFGSTAGGVSGQLGAVVSQGGFGAPTGSRGTQRSGQARVIPAGFNTTPEPAPVPRAVTTRAPVALPLTQPVITYEPVPVYSEAARAGRIQGTVDIRVKFRLDGSLEVLGIIRGLPGLNESALDVVRGIRFLPAATDFTTTVHVRFELL